jgi:acetylornithine deacetylase/succinyl-diaminopimelate desuccinylase-like protein
MANPLHLLFTADEEVGCWGAKKLMHEGVLRPRHAIVGEPTELVPVRAHKGYAAVDVTVSGVEGHSAFPDVGASAIQAAGKLLAEVERIEEEMKDEQDALFAPPWTTFNVGLIRGGKARNILAGECVFSLEWRPIPGQDPERALRLFDAAAARLAGVSAMLRARDAHALRRWNDAAREDRRRLLESELAGGAVHELRVTVPNRPGIVAALALALGRGGVNIVDMALAPAPDNQSGAITFWVAGDGAAERATELIAEQGYPVGEEE